MENIPNFLKYYPKNGRIRWLKKPSLPVSVGDIAGSLNENGYINILFKKKNYKAHRLAWYLHYGVWPEGQVDHINGRKCDNRIKNLRVVSGAENQQNRPCHRGGVLWGTSKLQSGKYYQSRVNGKYLGNFKTMKDAHLRSVSYAEENGIKILTGE